LRGNTRLGERRRDMQRKVRKSGKSRNHKIGEITIQFRVKRGTTYYQKERERQIVLIC